MTTFQKVVKYTAMAFAIFLTVSIIGGLLSMVGLFSGLFDRDAVTYDVKIYIVSQDIRKLEIKINAADFVIKKGSSFSVESNLKYLKVEDENGVLTIRDSKRSGSTYSGAVLTLYVPADIVFDRVNITTGAGRLTVDNLSADRINLDLGAGEVSIDTLIANSDIDINGGAGKITISDGNLNNLDLDMGVGQLNLTSALTGKGKFDLGIGESNITLIGTKDDYNLDIEKGIGNITIDGKNNSNIKYYGNGTNKVEISGGIGSINIKFK